MYFTSVAVQELVAGRMRVRARACAGTIFRFDFVTPFFDWIIQLGKAIKFGNAGFDRCAFCKPCSVGAPKKRFWFRSAVPPSLSVLSLPPLSRVISIYAGSNLDATLIWDFRSSWNFSLGSPAQNRSGIEVQIRFNPKQNRIFLSLSDLPIDLKPFGIVSDGCV